MAHIIFFKRHTYAAIVNRLCRFGGTDWAAWLSQEPLLPEGGLGFRV